MTEAETAIIAELRKINESLAALGQELAILHQWAREMSSYPRTVRLSSEDAYALSRRNR